MRIRTLLILILLPLFGLAQTSDEELAAQYFGNGEYNKAVVLYKKLFKKNPSSIYIYQNYLESLIKLNEYDEAEKILEKQIRRFPENYTYSVDLGHLNSTMGDDKKAREIYEDDIKNVSASTDRIESLAAAFLKHNLTDYAIQTYMKGRRILHSDAFFSEELVALYYLRGEEQKVVTECLNLLKLNAMNLPLVKSSLVRLIDAEKEVDFLQRETLSYLQKNPNNPAFDDLLMWVYLQQKKFAAASRQAMAMDKRERGGGYRVMELAKTCMENESYDIASRCYQYVVDLGPEEKYFMVAKLGLLESSYLQITEVGKYTREDLVSLESKYQEFLKSFGKNWNTVRAMKRLSELYIFYLHDVDKGIAILEQIVDMQRLQPHFKGEVKLSLGDAYLMADRVWDAALLYGQVDKEFKEDPLGQEAKFRNAQLSFYQGDFDWAKDQLDVLKTATSQLIANNAIELGLLIQDNMGLDSNYEAMNEYAKIRLLLFQNRYKECEERLQLLPFRFPDHALEDEIYFTKAQLAEKQQKWDEAIKNYTVVAETFGDDILADNALYNMALIYEDHLNDKEKALKTWESIILDHSGSLFVVEARKHYRKLKSDLGS